MAIAEREAVAVSNFETDAFPARVVNVRSNDAALAQPETVCGARPTPEPLLIALSDPPGCAWGILVPGFDVDAHG